VLVNSHSFFFLFGSKDYLTGRVSGVLSDVTKLLLPELRRVFREENSDEEAALETTEQEKEFSENSSFIPSAESIQEAFETLQKEREKKANLAASSEDQKSRAEDEIVKVTLLFFFSLFVPVLFGTQCQFLLCHRNSCECKEH
jgi:hypothetical protein